MNARADKQYVSLAAQRTHFHPRTAAANLVNQWHRWKGYTVSDYYVDAALEYFAIRNATGVFDLCPMNKYRIAGPDATDYLNRLVTRDARKLKTGRVAYAVWCDDFGKVIDDGTIFHLNDGDYRLCAYERHLAWLTDATAGFDVTITDETDEVAALAVQGPTSCAVLKSLGLTGIELLSPFGLAFVTFNGAPLMVSRTGFTGDLGYELWVEPAAALSLWDALFEAGRPHGIKPIGGDALDMARIEAGYMQAGVDFLTAAETVRPGRSRSPFELGLDWLVDFDKPHFNGRRALLEEQRRGSKWRLVRLDIAGNKSARNAYVYAGRKKQIGFVTSTVWSPVCKANIALASVDARYGQTGDELFVDSYYQRELHWSRVMAPAQVIDTPFWNPPRRRTTPPADY